MSNLEPQFLINNASKQIGLSSTLAKYGNQQLIFPHYEEIFISKAMEFTIKSMRDFENPSHINHNNPIFATSQWFLSLEYFISKLALIAHFEKHVYSSENARKFYNEYKTKNIYAKIHAICENLSLDKLLFKKSDLKKWILEFGDYRNALFHAGFFHGKFFNSDPISITIEHMMHAINIFISTINMFRGILAGIDLMTQYPIIYNSNAKFFDLDCIFNRIILPSFFEISRKHNLRLNFEQIKNTFSYYCDNSKFSYMVFINAEHDENSYFKFTPCKTQIFNNYLETFYRNNFATTQKDTIILPNCIRSTKDYL